jgi:hypothetical protein
MRPIVHLIVALMVSVILLLLRWNWWQLALFFVAAVFIDVDHYLYFVHKKKSWSLPQAYKYLVKLSEQTGKPKVALLMMFHTVEVFILLLILTIFFFNIFFPMLSGFILHQLFDFIHERSAKEKKYKRAGSLIIYIIKNAKK